MEQSPASTYTIRGGRRPVSMYFSATFRWTPFCNGVTIYHNQVRGNFHRTAVRLRGNDGGHMLYLFSNTSNLA
jgi:hypothetical protein